MGLHGTLIIIIIIENKTFTTMTLQTGDLIPEVLGKDQNGNEIRRSDFAGKKLVLYFYPKDNTSGCTAEACSFRDEYDTFRQQGWEVVGVSTDSESSHQKFIAKQALPFNLIADTDKSLSEQFGTWGEKKMCGRSYMGMLRTTFLVDEHGVITRVFPPKEIKTKEHAQQILKELQ